MAQIILQTPWALLLLPLLWLLLLLFAWRRRFKPFGPFLLRLLIVVLVTLALARPVIPAAPPAADTGPDERLVLLVDQSASLGPGGRQALRNEAARLMQGRSEARTLFFAGWPLLVEEPLAAQDDDGLLDSEQTNLAEALAVGGQLLAAGDSERPGRLLLLTDGAPTAGDALAEAGKLAAQEIPVDALLIDPETQQSWHDAHNEVRVVDVQTPPVLRQGETFDVSLVLHSQQPVSVTLTIEQDGEILEEGAVPLEAGLNRFNVTTSADTLGSLTYRVTLAAAAGDDRLLQNNRLSAMTQVYPPPNVLIVAAEPVQGSRLGALLREAGIEAEVMRPDALPTRLSELETYAGMVLLDVSARDLALEQMIAVQEFVRSLGRGLLVTGGRNSYVLGAYDDTPLADLLPVSLEPPPREERPPVALLLIVDHSGSMTEVRGDMPTRLTMAKEAAIRATDILGPDDLIGVLMFDNQYEWVVPFQPVSDGVELLDVQRRIARIPGGGGTRILQALEIGIPELLAQETANSRHIVLLTDGKSFDGDRSIDDYSRLVDVAVEENVTISTIAIGLGADEELLSFLAERGLGRYHFAETPEELPALTISESDILRTNALQEEGEYETAIYAPHPILRNLFAGAEAGQSPGVDSYLAMTPRPEAETALQVGPGDPLLSVWGYGLGRVVAWSSDTGAEWAAPWREWPDASRFWGQVVGYTLPAPDLSGTLQVEVESKSQTNQSDETITLRADSLTTTGQPVDRVRTEANLTANGGAENRFVLPQVGPGLYEREVQAPGAGAYRYAVTQQRSGVNIEAETGFVLPYPAEYALPPNDAGPALLTQIAGLTGGQTFALGENFLGGPVSAATEEAAADTELWPWLLQIALILWPIEIAWRRWARLRIN